VSLKLVRWAVDDRRVLASQYTVVGASLPIFQGGIGAGIDDGAGSRPPIIAEIIVIP